jgi:iduronate 2-sulfatase
MFVSIRRLLLLVLLTASLTPSLKADNTPQSRPNVLFLICDDLNCDLSCYGHPMVKSPNIDRLAARGVRFDKAYCQYPLCGPSRASFMAGMYPDQTLIHRNAIYIREHLPNVKTMSQMYRDAGYTATRIGKIYHYNVPLHIGTSGHDDPYSWDFTFNPRGQDRDRENTIFTLVPGQWGGTLSWRADDGPDEAQTDGMAATQAAALLKQYSEQKTPFFMAVGLYRPHTPYVAPKKYFEMYPVDAIKVPTVPEGYLDTIPEPARQSVRRKKDQINLADHLARRAIQAYYSSITFADAQVGRILDALEASGLSDNTVIVFTSDHGYHMGEHGHWQKTTLFENAARVPLVMAGPGVTAKGATSRSHAEMIDFYPTLAELCDLTPPKSISGISLVPTLQEASAQPRTNALTQYATGYSIRTDRYRYTEWGKNGADGAELYDHQSDTAEMHNLVDRTGTEKTIAELSALLRQRVENANRTPQGVTQLSIENRRRVPK